MGGGGGRGPGHSSLRRRGVPGEGIVIIFKCKGINIWKGRNFKEKKVSDGRRIANGNLYWETLPNPKIEKSILKTSVFGELFQSDLLI